METGQVESNQRVFNTIPHGGVFFWQYEYYMVANVAPFDQERKFPDTSGRVFAAVVLRTGLIVPFDAMTYVMYHPNARLVGVKS